MVYFKRAEFWHRTGYGANAEPGAAGSHDAGCLRCLLLVMCTHPFAKKPLTLHLARSEGHELYFDCNLMRRKVLASSHQHLMAEAPIFVQSKDTADVNGTSSQATPSEAWWRTRSIVTRRSSGRRCGLERWRGNELNTELGARYSTRWLRSGCPIRTAPGDSATGTGRSAICSGPCNNAILRQELRWLEFPKTTARPRGSLSRAPRRITLAKTTPAATTASGSTSDTEMPTKHAILAELTANELRASIDFYELAVADRRVKPQLVDTLARSRKARLYEILQDLSRERLKELCRTFDLDDSGRKKEDLVARLIRPAAASKNNTGNVPAPTRSVAEAPEPRSEELSVAQLEQYLWSAADILRGSIDSSDYKTYIFGLLFLKRLSDRFEEEAEKLIAKGFSETVAWRDPDEHEFFVPDRARWGTIQKRATNIGETLNKAYVALEEQNSALEGVLAGIDYNDEHKLGDARNRDTVLARLVQHFSQVSLRNDRMAEPDLLGRAYEYLIEKFADDAGKKGGEFYTPRMVVKLIVELLAPTERMRICDPTAGSGGMLIECAHYIERKGGNPRNLTLHGQEKNLSTWAICKMNMLLHGLPDARIEKGDTIRDPKLVDEGELLLYDRVIANPPFSLDEWGRDVAENDGHGRFRFGVPPKTKGDLAFVQHMVAVLNTSGRLGVVMPHGVLFRGSAEGKIRQGLLEENLFEAVIGLAPNLFYGTGIPASILVLNRNKLAARKGKVLFIDASGEFEEGSNQNRLRDQDIEHIAKTFHAYADVEKYARVVPLVEIEKNDWNLNISRYVDTSEEEERIDVAEAVRRLRERERERAAAEATMNRYLAELGYDN